MTLRSKSQHIAAMLVLLSGPAVCFEVIGAGLSRSGTYSTKLALNALGFKTYHYLELVTHPKQMNIWHRVAMGEATIDDALSSVAQEFNYTATLDSPMCKFYKRQMELFPEAKVLLTVRDSGKAWAESMWALHEMQVMLTRPFSITWPSPCRWYGLHKNADIWDFIKAEGFLPDDFGIPDADKGKFLQVAANLYDSHVAEVKAYVPENRLLVYNVKEGWDPLCRFLGVQAPDGPYPQSSLTSSKMFTRVAMIVKIAIYSWIPALTALTYVFRNRMTLLLSIVCVSNAVFYTAVPFRIGAVNKIGTELLFVIVLRCVFARHAHAKTD